MKILVIEDEPKVAAFIRRGLEENGYDVEHAASGPEGRMRMLERNADLIILDIMLPKINGFDLCQELRKFNNEVALIMLTALGSTDDKVRGLQLGADDYLEKPFHFKELLARIHAVMRRKLQPEDPIVYRIADLEMDCKARTVRRSGIQVRLTAKEFNLLELFLKNRGQVLTRADIAEKVWQIDFDRGTNVIDVYVNYLRNKIDKNFSHKLIHTQVGMGYFLGEEAL